MTSCPRSAKHAPATSPTYPDPTTAICIRYSGYLSENRFDNYFISFPAEVARITQRRPGQTSHRYVTTVTASAEATSAAPTLIVPSLQNIEYPGAKIQVMRLRSSLAFQLPPAENFSPSAPI